ncbi:MAG TPA: YkgJ family cysteine cluster protein [Candidatus Limnocylindrales bacterium]|nr:YkgJ family cysteine cluster protein [Candidatus Limnocylindrales bacterium]
MQTVRVEFRLWGEAVAAEVQRLPERASLDATLPALRVLDDQAAAIAVRRRGRPVSCSKGCSACCRIQPVPITPTEAYAISLLVDALPEPRRTVIRERFSALVRTLQSAGLAELYLEGRKAASLEEAQANARKYLDSVLTCPFLEDDACSIYEQRPFACREYFVTSPKEFCVNPLSLPVEPVPMMLSGARASMGTAAAFMGAAGYVIPLVLALEYAQAHGEELEQTHPGDELLTRSVKMLLASNPAAQPQM